jgi:aminopeptidase-like protein
MKHYPDEIDMMALLARLAPLNRTLACADTDQALSIIKEYLPDATIEGYPCGSAAWSWTLPQRWELDRATIKAGGETLVDSANSALHVVNYSQPFKGRVSRDELLKHLHSDPDRPDSIPFRFAFYNRDWGFCIPHAWRERFTAESYEVEIASRFEDGTLNVLSCFLPGASAETFVICADVCHPLQVNDSLTGLAVAVDIATRLSARTHRKYSYLVLVVPETIGSIAYLAHHPEVISAAVGGCFTEMLGTPGQIVAQRTRDGATYWDRVLEAVLKESGLTHKTVPFLKSAANDEKVLDSPGVDIPTFSMTRYPYPEYHSSDDNLALIDVERLREVRDVLQQVIDWAESDFIPVLNQPGPIFLSGHGLHPDWRADPSLLPIWESFIDVMYSIDNRRSFVEIALEKGITLENYRYWVDAFASKGLLTAKPHRVVRKAQD